MEFRKKTTEETLTRVELFVEVTANNNDVGYCVTNNNASGCGC